MNWNDVKKIIRKEILKEATEVNVKDLEGFIESSGLYKEWYPS